MAVDVSKIPNNSKFDPVREAILKLQKDVTEGVAGVATVNSSDGNITITNSGNITVGTVGDTITIGIDDSTYLTEEVNDLTAAVTWANVPDANITESSVTQHQAALSITESQISDLQSYLVASDLDDYLLLTETGTQTIAGNIVIEGDLTTSGSITYINSTHLDIGDNIIKLNADITSTTAPTEDAGFYVNRGSSPDVSFLWDEQDDKFSTYTSALSTASLYIGSNQVINSSRQFLGSSTISSTVPYFTFSGDSNTGVGRATNNKVSLIAEGVKSLEASDTLVDIPVDLNVDGSITVNGTDVYDNLPDGITWSDTDNRLRIGVSKNVGQTTTALIQPILLADLLTEGFIPYVASGGAGTSTINSRVSDSWLKVTTDTLELGASDPVSYQIRYARFLWQAGINDKISTVYGAKDITASIQYLGGSTTAKIEFIGNSGGGRIQFNDEYTFPATDGTSGQILGTNGSGDLSWVNGSSTLEKLYITGGDTTSAGTTFWWRQGNSGNAGGTWRKVCDVDIPTGLYTALSMDIIYYYSGSNHGASASLLTKKYSASFRRSDGTQDGYNDAILYGDDNIRVRIVKIGTGDYELQARAYDDNRSAAVKYVVTGGNANWVTPATSIVAGNTTGTAYTASPNAATDLELAGDIVAKALYDADNTAYYIDPNGTSVVLSMSGLGSNFNNSTVTGTFRASGDLNYFGTATTVNKAEIVVNTGSASSPQIGFTEHNDASWAIGVDDGDNSFKIHGTANATIPTINGLATPIFELTTGGLGYFGTQRIFADNYHPNADKWTAARTITLGGDLTGSVSIDGSSNVTLSAQVVNNSHTHDDRYYTEDEINRSLARLAGWVPAFSNSDESTVVWSKTHEAVTLKDGASDNAVGMAYKAIRMKAGDKVRIQIVFRGSTADTDGLYFRLYFYNGDLPDGKTHVSTDASTSSAFVQEDSSGDTGWWENNAITTSWQNFERTYTAPADGYMSLVVLNWSGYTGEVYVKQPDIQFEKVNDADKVDGLQASQFLRSDADDSISAKPTFANGSSGVLASRTGFADFIGYNPSYGSYIGGGVSNNAGYLYAGGFYNDGSTVHTLIHSGNHTSYTDGKYLRSNASDTFSGTLSWGGAGGVTGIDMNNGDIAGLNWLRWDDDGEGLIYPDGESFYWSGSLWQFTGGYVQAQGSMRAPIFYDSDSTTYYTNPASTSNMNRIEAYGEVLSAQVYNDPDVVFAVLEQDTSNSIRQKFRTTSTVVERVEDATAPSNGCFQITGQFYPEAFTPYYKIDTGDEYIFEFWIKWVSGTDTDSKIYAGARFYDANKTYLGNSQRYWGESGVDVDANSNNAGWYHVSGTLGPNRGGNTGDIPTAAEWMRLLFLFNYNGGSATVTRYCGLKVYKSDKTVTKLYRKTLGSEFASSVNRDLVIDSNGDINSANLDVNGNISFTGDSRRIDLSGGTTNSQNALIIGEQNVYGVRFRWDSGSSLHFDGYWNTSTTGAENRDLGYIDVNNRQWFLESTVLTSALHLDYIYHRNDTNTYTQFHAEDQWRVVTGGAERLEVNNSTTTLATNLQINSHAIDMDLNNVADNAISLREVRSSTWPFVFLSNDVGNDNESGFWINSNGYPDMRLRRDDGTVRALISSWVTSYVSNGFSISGGTLDMNNNDIVGVDQIVHEGDTDTYIQFSAADNWRVVTGGSQRILVNNSSLSSNVNIFAPNMYVNGYIYHNGDTNTYIRFVAGDDLQLVAGGRQMLRMAEGTDPDKLRFVTDNDWTNSSGQWRFSGRVGINADPQTNAEPQSKLYILGGAYGDKCFYFKGSGFSSVGAVEIPANASGIGMINNGPSGQSAFSFRYGASTFVGSILINSTSTSFNTTSDYRLKENLTDISDGIDRLKLLKPKRFNFIGHEEVVDGFIAHEAQKVVPESVSGEKDGVDWEGNPEYQGIDQAKLVPLLTAALQEAVAKIESLEARVSQLESNN